jgi:hypothetical protein
MDLNNSRDSKLKAPLFIITHSKMKRKRRVKISMGR